MEEVEQAVASDGHKLSSFFSTTSAGSPADGLLTFCKKMNPTGRALPNAPAVSGETEVVGLAYDLRTLRISVEDDAGTSFTVEFSDSIGFRVLDERDLLDFWPTFSTPAGWAFEVTSGGWHDLESQRRGGYLVPDVQPRAREFLITGCNDCVSIVALSEPTFQTEEQNKS